MFHITGFRSSRTLKEQYFSLYVLSTTTGLQLNMRSTLSWPLNATLTVYRDKWNKSKHTNDLFLATAAYIWVLCAFVNTVIIGLTSTIKGRAPPPPHFPTFSLKNMFFFQASLVCCVVERLLLTHKDTSRITRCLLPILTSWSTMCYTTMF